MKCQSLFSEKKKKKNKKNISKSHLLKLLHRVLCVKKYKHQNEKYTGSQLQYNTHDCSLYHSLGYYSADDILVTRYFCYFFPEKSV